jgi:hypothetical protein
VSHLYCKIKSKNTFADFSPRICIADMAQTTLKYILISVPIKTAIIRAKDTTTANIIDHLTRQPTLLAHAKYPTTPHEKKPIDRDISSIHRR